MKKILLLLILCACAAKTSQNTQELVSIQILDRNGFSETISAHDRLTTYEKMNFLSPQPYQKIVRVFGKASQGKTRSKISTYHPNGQPWQYLEIENGRAHGKFFEWHPSGELKIDAFVIEGTPDVSEMAQMTWLFEGMSSVYDEKGHLIAKIPYEKGLLEGLSYEFYPSGTLAKEIPYVKDKIHGGVQSFDEKGSCVEKISYHQGVKHGTAFAQWTPCQPQYTETYQQGRLLHAEYFDPQGKKIASIENGFGLQALFQDHHLATLVQYQNGIVEGAVKNFNSEGQLTSLYHVKDGMKNGEEIEYYPSSQHPKFSLHWQNDTIQGTCKTWYEDGVLESQREMYDNQKHGLFFAWFQEGDLMLMEEYENDLLMKGSYYKKWEKKPISKIENGSGIATLFDKQGKFLKKIAYEKGLPQKDS